MERCSTKSNSNVLKKSIMNYDNLKINTKDQKFEIGQKVKYKSHNDQRIGLFLEEVNNNEIKLVLLNNKLDQGIKVIINKNQIV